MKNLHIIPTDKLPIKGDLLLRHLWKSKPNECISWWRYNDTSTYGSVVVYTTLNGSFMDSPSSFKVQHIYITNSEEIKDEDWFLEDDIENLIFQRRNSKVYSLPDSAKKIVLTTDPDLIENGVQAIDDKFLEWFVKNPSCEEVEVEIETTSIQLPQQQLSENSYDLAFRWINKKVYKIIIPQEEPKTGYVKSKTEFLGVEFTLKDGSKQFVPIQSTLKEAAENKYGSDRYLFAQQREGFIEGAKWQAERMYSEEELLQALNIGFTSTDETWEECVEFAKEQFKKK